MTGERLRVAVLGGGIVGVSCAERLRRDGHQVTLYDPVPPGSAAQASYGNGGMLVPSSVTTVATPSLLRRTPRMLLDRDSPLHLRWRDMPLLVPFLLRFAAHARTSEMERIAPALATLAADAPEEHLDLARGTAAEAYLHMSDLAHLYPAQRDREKDRTIINLRCRLGSPSVDIEADGVAAIDPSLARHYRAGVRFSGHGYVSNPGAYVAELAAHFAQSGGELRQAEVEDVRQEGDSKVALLVQGSRVDCDRAVLCTGHHSWRWMRSMGLRPSLASERGYHLTLPDISDRPEIPCLLADAKVGVTPMQEGVRIGGLVEFAHRDAPPSRGPLALLHRLAQRLYPDAPWERAEEWMGSRPTTVDSLPLVGPSPTSPCIMLAFGTQHIGMTTGPRIGRWIAGLLADRKPNVDLAPYHPGRFARGD